MTYVCPVCGYSQLEHPPQDFTICPSCGTEFELDDEVRSPEQLRRDWLRAGAPWFDPEVPQPRGWRQYRLEELAKAGLDFEDSAYTTSVAADNQYELAA